MVVRVRNSAQAGGKTGQKEITMTTCQICGRQIKANTGTIAHHGYQRPGGGWQTASCMGAKYLPYEQSCDRIPAAIEAIETFISNTSAYLERIKIEPPDFLFVERGSTWNRKKEQVDRPADFNPNNKSASYQPFTYACEYASRVADNQRQIKMAKVDLKFLQERLAAWVAPVAA
jgi:hypothetical protein